MNPDQISSLLSLFLNIAALVLSLVALLATGIGFFASLKFYRDGMKTQQAVNRLLSKMEAKVESISAQVGGLLETTIKAVLPRPTEQAQAQTRGVAPTVDTDNPIALLTEEIRKAEPPGVTVEKLSALLALRFTNVSDPVGNLLFALGRDLAFNVFDGAGKVYYYGHFYKLEGAEIVKRVRILIGRLNDTMLKIMSAPEDPRRDQLVSLLRSTEIVVLIPGSIAAERVEGKIVEYQPANWQVPVKALTSESLEQVYRGELEQMEP